MNIDEMKNLEDELELKPSDEVLDSSGEILDNTSLIEVDESKDDFRIMKWG